MMNQNINGSNSSLTPPFISLTPSRLEKTDEKKRERSGTYSESIFEGQEFRAGSGGSMRAALEHSKSVSNSTSPLVRGHLENLGNVPMELISLGLPVSPSAQAIDVPIVSRRMRSSSLFSTNSIWNDDNVSIHSASNIGSNMLDSSSIHSFDINGSLSNTGNSKSYSNGAFLSPLLTTDTGEHGCPTNGALGVNQPLASSVANPNAQPRNRSYTTTGVVPNAGAPLANLSNGFANPLAGEYGTSSKYLYSPAKNMNQMFDGFLGPGGREGELQHEDKISNMNSANRLRAQTYSGSSPVLSNHSLNFPNRHLQVDKFLSHNLLQQAVLPQSQNSVAAQDPVLQDNCDLSLLVMTTSFENPNLGPTKVILIDNVPEVVDSFRLLNILLNSLNGVKHLGVIKSVRVSESSSLRLALIECSSIDVAMTLKANLNHLEIVPGMVLYVAFAMLVEKSPVLPIHQDILYRTNPVPLESHHAQGMKGASVDIPKVLPNSLLTDLPDIQDHLLSTITLFAENTNVDMKKIISMLNTSLAYPKSNYQDNFGPLPDPSPLRQFDSPKLRELRKTLESMEPANKSMLQDENVQLGAPLTQLDLENLSLAMLDELPKLCYDYLGNTIVQKVFSKLESPIIRLMMVKEIAPYLTQLSIHKNGTWAIQKIFNLSQNDCQQKYIIGISLKPYAVKLFNDQFGNYVIQCCLKFGSPFNDFIFETIVDNFLEISYGRFGARCVRTILETANESKCITKEQVLLIAGLIAEFSNELVVNNNGSLLITWFLDTFQGYNPKNDVRIELLTKKLIPDLPKLCTHKLANLTILKLMTNRSDSYLKQIIMDVIFGTFNDTEDDFTKPASRVLELILSENPDSSAGPLFIYKILSNQLLFTLPDDPDGEKSIRYQKFVVHQIRRILLDISVSNFQPYKKLMDEVGFSTNRLNKQSPIGNSRRTKRNGRHNHKLSAQGPNMNNSFGYTATPQSMLQHFNMQPNVQNINPKYQQMGPQVSAPNFNTQVQPNQYRMPQDQREIMMMKQLEQLSLSSAALGYSTPGTPQLSTNHRNQFF